MSKPLDNYSCWLDADGKIVTINDKEYKIRVTTHKAIYPYERWVINVSAIMVDQTDPEYLRIKNDLGDDWSTDVLESGDDIYTSIYNQCFLEKKGG